MKTRYLSINGLYRSGTTRVERQIDSQENMMSASHRWELPSIMAQKRGFYRGFYKTAQQPSFFNEQNTNALELK